MNIKFLFPFFIAVAVGLSACGKDEEPAGQGAAPQTGSAQEEATSGAQKTEAAKEESAPSK
jgi:hypothetical protein